MSNYLEPLSLSKTCSLWVIFRNLKNVHVCKWSGFIRADKQWNIHFTEIEIKLQISIKIIFLCQIIALAKTSHRDKVLSFLEIFWHVQTEELENCNERANKSLPQQTWKFNNLGEILKLDTFKNFIMWEIFFKRY